MEIQVNGKFMICTIIPMKLNAKSKRRKRGSEMLKESERLERQHGDYHGLLLRYLPRLEQEKTGQSSFMSVHSSEDSNSCLRVHHVTVSDLYRDLGRLRTA
jgi:hypothetical protein